MAEDSRTTGYITCKSVQCAMVKWEGIQVTTIVVHVVFFTLIKVLLKKLWSINMKT